MVFEQTKEAMNPIGPSGAPVPKAIKTTGQQMGGQFSEGAGYALRGPNFAYRPLYEIFIKTIGMSPGPKYSSDPRYVSKTGNLWRVTNAMTGMGTLNKEEDGAASLTFTLNNTGYVFSNAFEAMDMVAVFLKGAVGDFKQVFTGFIQDISDKDPIMQGGELIFQCYDVAKRFQVYTVSPGDETLLKTVTSFEPVNKYIEFFAKKAGFLPQDVQVEPMEDMEGFPGRWDEWQPVTPEGVDGKYGASDIAKAVADYIENPDNVAGDKAVVAQAAAGVTGKDTSSVDDSVREAAQNLQAYQMATYVLVDGMSQQKAEEQFKHDNGYPPTENLFDHPDAVQNLRDKMGYNESNFTKLWNFGTGLFILHDLQSIFSNSDASTAKKESMALIEALQKKLLDGKTDANTLAQWLDKNVLGGEFGDAVAKMKKIKQNLENSKFVRPDMVYPIVRVGHSDFYKDLMIDNEKDEVTFIPTRKGNLTMSQEEKDTINKKIDDAMAKGKSWVNAVKQVVGTETVDITDGIVALQTPQQQSEAQAAQNLKDNLNSQLTNKQLDYLSKKGNDCALDTKIAYKDKTECLYDGWLAVSCCYGTVVSADLSKVQAGIGRRVIIEADDQVSQTQQQVSIEQNARQYYWDHHDELKDKYPQEKDYTDATTAKWRSENGITGDTGAPSTSAMKCYFFYSHLGEDKGDLAVKSGSKVKPGDTIGTIGASGVDENTQSPRLSFRFSPYGLTGKFEDPGLLLQQAQTSGKGDLTYSDMEFSPYIFAQEWITKTENRQFSKAMKLPFFDEVKIIDLMKESIDYGGYHFWADGMGRFIARHPRYFSNPKFYIPKEMTLDCTLMKTDRDMVTHAFVVGDINWDWAVDDTPFTPDAMETGQCTVEDMNATVFAWNKGASPREICNKFGIRKTIYDNKFLHNRQQCARYAMYKFVEANRMRCTAQCTTILMPGPEFFDQVFVESKNMMFTITGIQHQFGIDAQNSTTLTLVAGISPDELGSLRAWLNTARNKQVSSAQSDMEAAWQADDTAKAEWNIIRGMPKKGSDQSMQEWVDSRVSGVSEALPHLY